MITFRAFFKPDQELLLAVAHLPRSILIGGPSSLTRLDNGVHALYVKHPFMCDFDSLPDMISFMNRYWGRLGVMAVPDEQYDILPPEVQEYVLRASEADRRAANEAKQQQKKKK
ncbi:MAG: hypothetical protein D6790_15015 [Caldilineae bacterium]|nr:MAG: hypothetical protein D6790_15015 [Caldilineae bacterium]